MPVLQVTPAVPSKPKSTKPSTKVMVDNALKSLDDRNGTSLQAVKKFIATSYNIDVEASSNRIKKYIKEGLESGKLVKTSGKGAGGSFKLSPTFKATPKLKMKFKPPETQKDSIEKLKKDSMVEKKTQAKRIN